MHRRIALSLSSLAVFAVAGCSAGQAPAANDDGGLQIVATTTQVGDFTRQVAGDDAEVTQLLQPGQSAHSYDPTPTALQALQSADVLVVNGAGLEAWLDDTIEASGFDGTLIDTSEHVHLHEGEAHDHDADHADEEHADHEDAAHQEEHDHDHGGTDPHVWTDPANAMSMVETIADALADADPDRADEYQQRASEYLGELDQLLEWMHASVDPVPVEDRLLVTNHDTFSYLAEALDITVVGQVMPSFDDNAEPSAADIDALVADIRATGASAVFSETSIDPQLAETIASEAGVAVFSGEDALYGDALGPADSDGATYISSQIHNVSRIVESWGASPAPVPDTLAP